MSAAGKRAGIKAGTRSGLWAIFAEAIDALRPQYVVIENVRGLLSATAHRNVEPANGTVGDRTGGPVLRAAGAVLGDLADLGYDAVWTTVAAADVGAPHRRERVFILATDTTVGGRQAWQPESEGQRRQPVISTSRDCAGSVDLLPTPTAQAAKHGAESRFGGGNGDVSNLWQIAHLLPTPTTQDGANTAGQSQFQRNTLPLNAEVTLLPTPNASDASGGGQHPDKREGHSRQLIDYVFLLPTPLKSDAGPRGGTTGYGMRDWTRQHVSNGLQWGKYAPAIHRWETITRPAPAPTEPNKNGNPRLSAAFSEWLMGWPDGWVTDPDIGISRNDQLRIVGNGVCPQQAAAALRYLLSVSEVAA